MTEPTEPPYSFLPAPKPSAVALAAAGLLDLIIATVVGSILGLPFLLPAMFKMFSGTAVVAYTQTYVIQHEPASDTALVAWGRRQPHIREVTVTRLPDGKLELRRKVSMSNDSPLYPPWKKLGYTGVHEQPLGFFEQSNQATLSLIGTANVLIPVILCSSAGVLFAAWLRLNLRRGRGMKPLRLNFKPTWSAVLLGIVGAAALLGFDQAYEFVMKAAFHISIPGDTMFSGARDFSPTGKALMLLAGAVLAPVAEETLFRGVIFGGMQAEGYVRAAFIVSAFLFAAAHGSLLHFVPLFAFGLIAAWLYRRTGTLAANITAHAVNNAAAFIFLFLGNEPDFLRSTLLV